MITTIQQSWFWGMKILLFKSKYEGKECTLYSWLREIFLSQCVRGWAQALGWIIIKYLTGWRWNPSKGFFNWTQTEECDESDNSDGSSQSEDTQRSITFPWYQPSQEWGEVLGSDDDINGANDDTVRMEHWNMPRPSDHFLQEEL